MQDLKTLTAGLYSGKDINGNYGWLLVTKGGGRIFFIRGFSDGLIKHNQIDEHVSSVQKDLDPEDDRTEFLQAFSLIQQIENKFPNTRGLSQELQKVVVAFSILKYNDPNKIKIP